MPLTDQPSSLGFGSMDPSQNAPAAPSAWQQSETRLKREQAATTGDYLGSIWRQDGLVDGLMGGLVGHQMAPDPAFNPYTDPGAKASEDGVWDEFKPELYKTHSAAHREFVRGRLLDKQEDLVRMGDMGWQGQVGRIALNAVMPEQILSAMAGGWAVRGAFALKGAMAARSATGALEAATAAAGVGAEQAALHAGGKAIAGGIAFGGAQNAAFEKLRQSVNFEDDTTGVLEAGLMGAALSAPFAFMGAKAANRAAAVASKEHDVLRALKAVDEGHPLTPEQGTLLHETLTVHKALQDFERGALDEAGVAKALDEFHGPAEPAERWMARHTENLQADTKAFIAEMFPNAEGRATGMAPPSEPQRLQMDQQVHQETLVNFPESRAAANAANPQLEGALQSAFKKTLIERDKLRKAFDLETLDATTDAAKKAERAAAHAQAEADRASGIKADQERMINAREQARMVGSEDPLQVPREAPAAPSEPVVHAEVAPQPPHPAEAFLGREVSWAGPDGETFEGTARSISPSGKPVVDTGNGPKGMKSVSHTQLDQAPHGFLGGSVGAAQVGKIASIMEQRTAMAEKSFTINGKEFTIPTRFDIYSVLNGSPVLGVRKLAYKLVKDAIQNDKFEAQGMTASEWKKQLQRTAAGRFHVEAGEAFSEAIKAAGVRIWERPAFAGEFYSMVSRVTRGDDSMLVARPELAGPVRKAAAAQAQAYKTLIEQAKAAGVKGAADIQPNDFYVNRVWHHGNIREAFRLHGEAPVYRLVADSIQDKAGVLERMRKSPGNTALGDDELLLKKAKGFIGAVRALEFNPALREIHLAGRDMATLRSELGSMGVADHQIDDLVDLMFEVRPQEADAGRAASLKFRFALDETAGITTDKGALKLADLFENDSRVLVDRYTNTMAGHIGLAKVGIDSQATWAAHLKAAAEEAQADPLMDGNRVAKDLALLNDVYKNITGRPMSDADFSASARTAAAVRAYTRGVMLPQLGIAAATEMGKAIALMGFKSLMQMPSLRSLLVGMRQGYIPDKGLARDIMLISGFGQEKAASYIRGQEIENGFFGQTLTRAEAGANKVSHAVDVMSGNASFTSLTKQLSGMMAVQSMADFAHGRKKMTAKLQERWVGQGISTDDIDSVLGALKKHSGEKDGVVQGIDYEGWLKDSPQTYEKFQTFLSRQVRDAIQDHDLGETMPFMHSTVGKMFSELKTFFLVGHAKNFLKQLNYMDSTAVQVWTIGFLGESLGYMTQTAINYPTELDTRLTPDKIATAAFFRMSALGTASMLTETGYGLLTGESLVQPGTTANTDNRSFLNTPSLIVAKRVGNAMVTGTNALLHTDVTTKKEFKDAWGAIPGANLYGLKAAGNWWAETLPKSDPDHRGQ